MRVLSVNVARPREVLWANQAVSTGIFKQPVSGPVRLRRLNLDGDEQADLTVHGGPYKAVYAYPTEHYAYWREQLPAVELPAGAFGENLTLEGLLESAVHIGDRFRIGTAEIVATQPRLPCYKLGIKFGRMDIVKRFADSRRTGFYFSVAREGELRAGDAIELLAHNESSLTIAEVARLYLSGGDDDREEMRQAVELESLPESWRNYFRQRLDGT